MKLIIAWEGFFFISAQFDFLRLVLFLSLNHSIYASAAVWKLLIMMTSNGNMFALICVWTNGWANNQDAGDLRRHRAHYDVTAMSIRVGRMALRASKTGGGGGGGGGSGGGGSW